MRRAGADILRRGGGGAGRRAFTLAELMAALLIFAVVAMACGYLLGAMGNTQSYVRSTSSTLAELELAVDRVVDNTRSATAGTFSANSLQLTTPPDPTNTIYIVTYAVSNGQLTETTVNQTTQAVTTNTLVHTVQQFTVARLGANPNAVQITLSAGPPTALTRSFVVLGRNF